jgi:hypothetical protein
VAPASRVLDEFLDDAGGPFNHLAGGDLLTSKSGKTLI